MIPKIAYFHWDGDGPPMDWLRHVSIATFAKFNPTWEIRLIRTHPIVRAADLGYAQKADITWWKALEAEGGWQVATDIVFTKPVPEAWLDAELCACTNGRSRVYQFAMLGAVPGHPFIRACVSEGMRRVLAGGFIDYQDLGVWLLKDMAPLMGPVKELPMSALCHYDDLQCETLWDPAQTLDLPEEAIGVHWYGGHVVSRELEWAAGPGSPYPIVKLAESVFP